MNAAAHLAQYNISRLRHPIGHPATRPFEDLIDETNARAESSPGFVWRHGIDSRDTGSTAYDDPLVLVNASVWESPQHLRDFAYRDFHRDVFRRRDEWMAGSAAVMWWVPAGDTPSLEECKERLWFFEEFGSSPYAFRNGERLPQLVIRRHRPDDDVARPLLAALDRSLLAATPTGGSNFLSLPADDVAPGAGLFAVAWLDDTPVGCGAWRRIDADAQRPDTGEVKRMWVDPAARGSMLGAAILAALEASARAAGISELRLETAEYLEQAMRLYRRFGFDDCPPWGEYAGAVHSRTLAKPLGPIRHCSLSAHAG